MAKKKRSHAPGRLNSLTACMSTTMVLVLIGLIVFIGTLADNLGRSVKENFTIEVLLDDSLNAHDAKLLKADILAMPYAKQVTYITKEQATRTMAEDFGTNPNEFLGNSPFPASLEVKLNADYTTTDSLNRYMPSLKKAAGVTEVIYPEDLMEQVNRNIAQIAMVLFAIAVLLTLISVALINNTMRLNVAQRRQTIQTMKLVGASWSFIRRPYLIRAFWMGLIASILACGVIYVAVQSLLTWDTDLTVLVTPYVMLTTCGSVFASGVFLTLVCAYFSVNKHLSMSRDEATLY